MLNAVNEAVKSHERRLAELKYGSSSLYGAYWDKDRQHGTDKEGQQQDRPR
jgi:hypothetical protein